MFKFFNHDKPVQKPVVEEKDEKAEEIKTLNARIRELKREKQNLVETVEEMKFKKRLEQEEVVHINKLERERMKQELDNEKASLAKQAAESMNIFKEQQRKELIDSLSKFHTKMESRFSEELKNLKEVYALLMQRLPNVNLDITRHEGNTRFIESSDKPRDKR